MEYTARMAKAIDDWQAAINSLTGMGESGDPVVEHFKPEILRHLDLMEHELSVMEKINDQGLALNEEARDYKEKLWPYSTINIDKNPNQPLSKSQFKDLKFEIKTGMEALEKLQQVYMSETGRRFVFGQSVE